MKRRSRPHQPHDRSYRALFSHPEIVTDLIRGYVDARWVSELDFGRLERLPAAYLSGLTERRGDTVWRLPWRDGPLYLLLLLEIQSSNDRLMPLRLSVYAGLLLSELARRGEFLQDGALPPLIPLVVYNGERPWSAPRDLESLFPELPADLERLQPRLSYLLLDERRTEVDPTDGNLVSALVALEQSSGPDDLQRLIQLLAEQWDAPRYRELRRTLLAWIRHVLVPTRIPGGELPDVERLSEVSNMLQEKVAGWVEDWKAEGLRAGREQGLREGRREGREQGRREGRREGKREGRREGRHEGRREGEIGLLKHQLQLRFGPVSSVIDRRLDAA
ncbi:MAG: Rpn family recombination-promoting nuclease/putative transposase [Acidobacteriota bacterium]